MYIYYFVDGQETNAKQFAATGKQAAAIVEDLQANKDILEPLEGTAELHCERLTGNTWIENCSEELLYPIVNQPVTRY